MVHFFSEAPTVLASFMASTVEFVEALTIVLAVGTVRGWRSALLGTAAATVVLLLLVVCFGSSLAKVPLPVVQVLVGTLLLMFGLRWLRKAILRAAALIPLHDESAAFSKQAAALRAMNVNRRTAIDRIAFVTAFKIVMLEGIEVVFIVIAIGAGGPLIMQASIGALLALLLVVLVGFFLKKPLARVPENELKFLVGVLLSAFGVFWVGEGLALPWSGHDLIIVGLVAVFLSLGFCLIPLAKALSQNDAARERRPVKKPQDGGGPIASILAEIWGLFVDDGWLAAGVVAWVAFVCIEGRLVVMSPAMVGVAFIGGIVALLVFSTARYAHRR